jgi:hypothetical protein
MVKNKRDILYPENDIPGIDNDDSVTKTKYKVTIISKGYLYLISDAGLGTRVLIEGKYKNAKVGDTLSV